MMFEPWNHLQLTLTSCCLMGATYMCITLHHCPLLLQLHATVQIWDHVKLEKYGIASASSTSFCKLHGLFFKEAQLALRANVCRWYLLNDFKFKTK